MFIFFPFFPFSFQAQLEKRGFSTAVTGSLLYLCSSGLCDHLDPLARPQLGTDPRGAVTLDGATVRALGSYQDAMLLLEKMPVEAHSHNVVHLGVRTVHKSSGQVTRSKLVFVDLAPGSISKRKDKDDKETEATSSLRFAGERGRRSLENNNNK
jgi:hypothetical protein